MVRSLSPILQRELANLDKDAESRRTAMKTLTSYAKDLDCKALPQFLAQVSDTKGATSSSGECTISLFEVLARVHGRNIVPQIDNIMSTIVRTLSLSGGSFPLQQACSKVVPAIARYGMDPSTADGEKARIIYLLCRPLSDALMCPQESLASGASLCLKALVECSNWKFASEEVVGDVCLKVAGSLEEKATQTNSHMGLAMALAKHNVLTVEAYAGSLLRSGLKILDAGGAMNNSQRRFSAIQMINFLMKCVDSRCILPELVKVVEVMETCQADHMPYVRGAAFEALQTARSIISQKGSRHETSPKPVTGSNFDRSPRAGGDNSADFASPESQTVESCLTYDAFTDSPAPVGQSSSSFEYSRRANRRLWNNDLGGVDVSFKDGLFLKACSSCGESKCNGESGDTGGAYTESFSGFVHARPANSPTGNATASQRFNTQLKMDDIKIYATPRKLVRSLQDPDANSQGSEKRNLQMLTSPKAAGDRVHETELASKVEEGALSDYAESVSSTDGLPQGSSHKVSEECEGKEKAQLEIKRRARYGRAAVGFVGALLFVLLAVALSAMRDDNEAFFDVVPT
ncbi:uncharacterized protein M6B38_254565 [Iris pallida]|uniref:TORTIFOLIA1/SINE1-2 N-terminal domain-containing protein n=1 Tax=Iris pallida TaxID=29817 RepID=A0AAX6IG62_IRIPA|nr:uncharacterized protein M6B38_254565 [Iris pallida]